MKLKDCFTRRAGDRYDGWRIRNIDPVYSLMPYVQPTRVDSQCFFEENVDLEQLETFIRTQRQTLPGLSIMHVVIAAVVRTLSQRPYSNRFLVHNKLYAHNDIKIALMIKRSMSDDGAETPITPIFQPTDTLADIVARVNAEIAANREESSLNSADKLSGFLGKLPPFLLRFVIWIVRGLDNVGLLPKDMHAASPYHCSVFVTNVGSLGIEPIYHHLYEFGTCSFFVAMGRKVRREGIDRDGNPIQRKTIGLRFTIDERISDGRYHALTIRYLRKLLNDPSALLVPPEQVLLDNGLGRLPVGNPLDPSYPGH